MKQLLPHQIEDAKFLASRKGVTGNFSGMGSGKTLTALAAIEIIGSSKPVIVIGPPISLRMWEQEIIEFFGDTTVVLQVKTGKSKLTPANVYVVSYEIATKRVAELKALGAVILICDESHALKSVKAKRTKAILGTGGLVESVDYAWMLTGTPSTRWNDDMFSFMARADNAGLKAAIGGMSLDRFRLQFCITQKKRFGNSPHPVMLTVGNRNTDVLNEMLFRGSNPVAVRRELREVWEAMPPLTINRLPIPLAMDPELREAIRLVDGMSLAQIETDRDGEHLSTLRRNLGMAKISASVKEIAARVEAGTKPILVGAWHTEVIDAIASGLSDLGIKVLVLDGRTPATRKAAAVDAFNAGEIDVIVGQIAAMGVSLNLQGGSHIIVVEQDWSPALMSQFYARCHRIGQRDHVHVDILESDTKLDKAVRKIAQRKASGHRALTQQEETTTYA